MAATAGRNLVVHTDVEPDDLVALMYVLAAATWATVTIVVDVDDLASRKLKIAMLRSVLPGTIKYFIAGNIAQTDEPRTFIRHLAVSEGSRMSEFQLVEVLCRPDTVLLGLAPVTFIQKALTLVAPMGTALVHPNWPFDAMHALKANCTAYFWGGSNMRRVSAADVTSMLAMFKTARILTHPISFPKDYSFVLGAPFIDEVISRFASNSRAVLLAMEMYVWNRGISERIQTSLCKTMGWTSAMDANEIGAIATAYMKTSMFAALSATERASFDRSVRVHATVTKDMCAQLCACDPIVAAVMLHDLRAARWATCVHGDTRWAKCVLKDGPYGPTPVEHTDGNVAVLIASLADLHGMEQRIADAVLNGYDTTPAGHVACVRDSMLAPLYEAAR